MSQEVSRCHSTESFFFFREGLNNRKSQVEAERISGIMTAKYCEQAGCLQRDSVERQEYAGAPSARTRDSKEQGGARNEKLALAGYYDFPAKYEQIRKLHLCD